MFFVFFASSANNNSDEPSSLFYQDYYEFFGIVGNKKIYINEVDGPVDKENIINILNLNEWDEKTTERIIMNFRRAGIQAKITINDDCVFISLVGPSLVVQKQTGKNPLNIPGMDDKKYLNTKSKEYHKLRNSYGNFWNLLEVFTINYGLSAGRAVEIKSKNPKKYRSFIKIKEQQIPIVFVLEDFIDVPLHDRDVLFQIFHEIQIQNSIKSENIFLKLFSKLLGESGHFVANLGKKEKETIVGILKNMGYVNAKFIQKTFINHMGPDKKIIKTGIVYSLFLGKKSTLRSVVLQKNSLPNDVQKLIQKILEETLLNNNFVFHRLKDLDKILEDLNVKCVKTSIVQTTSTEFNLQIWVEYKDIDRFYQDIIFKNFKCSSNKLLRFAKKYKISVGSVCEDENLNNFTRDLKKITGQEVNFSNKTDRGIEATFTGGNKPRVFSFVENIVRVNPQEGLVLSFIQFQWFLILNQLFQVHIIPEVSTDFSGFVDFFTKIKAGGKLDINYWTENNLNINLTSHGMLRLKEFGNFVLWGNNSFLDSLTLDSKLSLNYEDLSFFASIYKNNKDKEKYFNENNVSAYIYNKNYLFSFGATFDHTFQKQSNFHNIGLGIKTFHPITKQKKHGLHFTAEYGLGFSHMNNSMLWRIITAYAPLLTEESSFATSGEYRIPGVFNGFSSSLSRPFVSNFIVVNRFLLTTEIWDSSMVFLKMLSLMVGIIGHLGCFGYFSNLENFIGKKNNLYIVANVGFIIILDLMGTISFFLAFIINFRGELEFDFGVIHKLNPFTQNQMAQSMMGN